MKHELIYQKVTYYDAVPEMAKYKFDWDKEENLVIKLLDKDLFDSGLYFETPEEKLQIIFTSLYAQRANAPYWNDKGRAIMMNLCNLIEKNHPNIKTMLEYGKITPENYYPNNYYSDLGLIEVNNIALHVDGNDDKVMPLSDRLIDKVKELTRTEIQTINRSLPDNEEDYGIIGWRMRRQVEHLKLDMRYMEQIPNHVNEWVLKDYDATQLMTSVDDLYEIVHDSHFAIHVE